MVLLSAALKPKGNDQAAVRPVLGGTTALAAFAIPRTGTATGADTDIGSTRRADERCPDRQAPIEQRAQPAFSGEAGGRLKLVEVATG